jgi:hypothetical protein
MEDHVVTYLHIDSRFAFDCWWADNNQLSVIIETLFTIRCRDQTTICEPEDINSVKEALSILHKPMAMLTAYRDGRLLVSFSDGTELRVSKHPQYESWEARGIGELEDLALHCTPHEGPPWRE